VAATNELKTRIRNAITCKSRDPHTPLPDRYLLKKALLELDEASISTIHGFCKEILTERAFESGSLFQAELDPEESTHLQASVDDFFRHRVVQREIEEQRLMKSGKKEFNYHYAVAFTRRELFNPIVTIMPESVPDQAAEEIKALEAEILALFNELQALPVSVRKANPALDDFMAHRSIISLCRSIEDLAKKKPALGSPFDAIFARFVEKLSHYAAKSESFRKTQSLELINFIPECMNARKKILNILSYDDLIQNLWQALRNGPAAESLARAVRLNYRAVLIDEFQDTDPLQFDIFKTLFFPGPPPTQEKERTVVFLIGDPKQSIYSFRGADIFSYRKAQDYATMPHSLDSNWRSEAGLIQAVNRIFSQRDNPFVYDWIPFTPASHPGAEKPAQDTLLIEGRAHKPFQIIFIDRDKMPPAALYQGRITRKESNRVIARCITGRASGPGLS